jgi:hypothetical protein
MPGRGNQARDNWPDGIADGDYPAMPHPLIHRPDDGIEDDGFITIIPSFIPPDLQEQTATAASRPILRNSVNDCRGAANGRVRQPKDGNVAPFHDGEVPDV